MGIDAEIYAEGDVTDAEIDAADMLVKARCEGFWWGFGNDKRAVVRGTYEDELDRIVLRTGSRYYGPGYERGDWPAIYAAIRAMRAALPTCTIYYGGDSSDEHPEATEQAMQAIWDHWCSPNGDDYHKERVTWTQVQA